MQPYDKPRGSRENLSCSPLSRLFFMCTYLIARWTYKPKVWIWLNPYMIAIYTTNNLVAAMTPYRVPDHNYPKWARFFCNQCKFSCTLLILSLICANWSCLYEGMNGSEAIESSNSWHALRWLLASVKRASNDSPWALGLFIGQSKAGIKSLWYPNVVCLIIFCNRKDTISSI